MKKYYLPLALATACGLIMPAAHAADATLELLAQKGLISAEEYAAIKEKTKNEASISLNDGLKIRSHDGRYSAQLGVLMQLDMDHVEQTARDAASGSELRRARFNIGGSAGDWRYRLEAELSGTVAVTDAWAAWQGPVTVTGGNFKIPYSLESLMSDKDLAFMERSLSSSLLPTRAPGLMVGQGHEQASWAVGVFGEPITTASTDDEGGGISGRASWAPMIGDGRTLHLASPLHWREASQGTTSLQKFSSKPEVNVFPTNRLQLNTGNIAGADNLALLGLEAAKALGPLLLQAEYSQLRLSRQHQPDLHFKGGYAQAAWALTGERRSYDGKRGIFGGIKPEQAVAWELALRLSQLDLDDAGLHGGQMQNLSASLNSYIGAFVKLSLNHVRTLDVEADSPNARDGKVRALMLRAQFAY